MVQDFLLDCELKGLQDISIKSYKQKLSYFFKGYKLTQEDVNRFVIDKKREGAHTATINGYLRAIKAYSRFEKIDINIRFLKEEEIVKDPYTPEEIRRLIKKPDTNVFGEFKIWALECFLFGTGCRISTALEIKVEDIDFDSGYVLFKHTKNGRNQYFPISKELKRVLREYLSVRGESGYLFCNKYGNKGDKRSTQKMIANYNHERGVSKTSAHLFRHTFAAEYIKNGGNAMYLQRLLGHSTLDMTRKYVNLYSTDLKCGLEGFSALDCNCRHTIKMK